MRHEELMAEAARLAIESVERGWGGPFGALVARDGEVVARGQNRVLLTGDPTAHGEIEAIREAVRVLNPWEPSIAPERRNESTLELVPRPEGSSDPEPVRARMLLGCSLYTSGIPCPMCMGAIYWSRIEAVYYSSDLATTRAIGFDDAFQYDDFQKPLDQRSIRIEQVSPELGAQAYATWANRPDRHPY
jgi:guanine deaminase